MDRETHNRQARESYHRTKGALKRYHKNRDENLGKMKEYHLKNKERLNRSRVLRKFGLSIEDFKKISDEQKGLCKICRLPPNGNNEYLSVDHNHATGKIRGLLCSTCNSGLGYFKDSANYLRAAADYLDRL